MCRSLQALRRDSIITTPPNAPPKRLSLIKNSRGARVAQSVKRQTPDFGSGHDLMAQEFEAHVGLHTGSAEPAWDSLSLRLPRSCLLTLSLSQSK